MDHGEINLLWGAALVEGLVDAGVTRVVVSPGSRSTPITLACALHPAISVWVVPDERCAAFFGLGLSKNGGPPAAVIATSGSAPANWYPAVVEAAYDMQPLVLVSADRPAELQRCGANQTVDQAGMFGSHVRAFFALPEADSTPGARNRLRHQVRQAVDGSCWPVPGPVHVNVPLSEPLAPATEILPMHTGSPGAFASDRPLLMPAAGLAPEVAKAISGRPGLIVCGRGDFGPGFADVLVKLAARLGAPVMADPLSGLRFGEHDRSHVLSGYDAFLRREETRARFGDRCRWLLRFGAALTSKVGQQFIEALTGIPSFLVVPYGTWPDPSHSASMIVHADPRRFCEHLLAEKPSPARPDWAGRLRESDKRVMEVLTGLQPKPLEARVLSAVARSSPPGALVFCGNSMVIRDVDSFLPGGQRGLRLVGNRGASGIDGNVSTAMGLAAASDGPVVALLGDLALYHDMNGLLAARDLDVRILVFNNGGGGIFRYMPQARLPDFNRFWLTPTGLDIERVAALYGIDYVQVGDDSALEHALKQGLLQKGPRLLDVVIDPEASVQRHRLYWDVVSRSL